jgi:hypothetical protein
MKNASNKVYCSVIVWLFSELISLPHWTAENSDSRKWFDPALFRDPKDGELDISVWNSFI